MINENIEKSIVYSEIVELLDEIRSAITSGPFHPHLSQIVALIDCFLMES